MKAGTEVIGKCLFIVPEIVVFASSMKNNGLTNGRNIYCFGMQNTRFVLRYAMRCYGSRAVFRLFIDTLNLSNMYLIYNL